MKRLVSLLCLLVFTMLLFATGCYSKEAQQREIENEARQWVQYNTDFDTVSIQEVSLSDNNVDSTVTCIASSSGQFFDVTATIELEFKKSNDQWALEGDPFYCYHDFDFHPSNGKFYHFGHRDISELFQIQKMSETLVSVQIYGLTSQDCCSYSKTEEWALHYVNESQCFEFQYYGGGKSHRIYPDHIEVGKKTGSWGGMVVSQYTEYKELDPEDPNNYWWLEHITTTTEDGGVALCNSCNGKGIINYDVVYDEVECSNCSGKGTFRSTRPCCVDDCGGLYYYMSIGSDGLEYCTRCGACGLTMEPKCTECDGDGKIEKSVTKQKPCPECSGADNAQSDSSSTIKEKYTIPEVDVGEYYDPLAQQLQIDGVDFRIVRKYDSRVEKDGIISVDPSPGTEIVYGSEVVLYVSAGAHPSGAGG